MPLFTLKVTNLRNLYFLPDKGIISYFLSNYSQLWTLVNSPLLGITTGTAALSRLNTTAPNQPGHGSARVGHRVIL